jgi:hypothetical protein
MIPTQTEALDTLARMRALFRSMRDSMKDKADIAEALGKSKALVSGLRYSSDHYGKCVDALDLAFEAIATMPKKKRGLIGTILNKQV